MKKFRLLSSLLAALMVLSIFSGITVSAKQIDANTFFCDFEEFELGKAASGSKVFSDAGIKWTRFYYSGDNTYYNTPENFKIVSDETFGKGIQAAQYATYLGFGLTDNVTTGKVRLGFSLKAGNWGNLQGVFSGSGYAGTAMANIGTTVTVLNGNNQAVGTGKALTAGQWYYVECVVDLDANSWTFYVDGELVNSYTMSVAEGEEDPITTLRGFSLYCGSSCSAVVDNVTVNRMASNETALTILDKEITETDDKKTQIKLILSDSVAGKNVTLSQCGGADLPIDSKITHNVVTLTTQSGTITKGCEYMIKLGEDILYVYEPLDEVIEKDTGVKDFEDVTTKVYTGRTTAEVSNQYVVGGYGWGDGILASHNFRVGSPNKGYPLVYTTELDSSDTTVGTNNASGKVIYPKGWEAFRLLKPIKASYGKEVYEFDFKWTNSGANFDLKTVSDSKLIARVGSANKWKHMRIEYDRATNIATSYVDGVQNQSVETTGFGAMLQFATNSSDIVFWMDNYRSYVEYAPLAVESVRYTAGAETTGANLISPETTKIDITFTEAVKADTLGGIALTADGKTIAPDVDVNGKVVTLKLLS